MAVLATGREIIDIAVGIERNGAAFYDQLAKIAKKEKTRLMSSSLEAGRFEGQGAGKAIMSSRTDVRDTKKKATLGHSDAEKEKVAIMYSKLADREREHMKTFQNMLGPGDDYVNMDHYTEEYDLYLKNLVDSAVFKNERSAREAAQKAASESEAVDIGIQAEKDSILFYSAIQSLVRRADADIVDAIIKEERSHLAQLSDLRTRLGKSPGSRQKRGRQ